MLSRQRFDAAAFRLANYHLDILKDISDDFQQGRFSKRADFERHWSQIKQSHQFMSERLTYDTVAADYCLQFILTSYHFLYAWRPLNETSLWVEVGIRASEHLNNQDLTTVLHHQISIYFVTRQLELAQSKIDVLLALADDSDNVIAKAHGLLHQGRFYLTKGLYDESKEALSESSVIYQQLSMPTQYGWTLHNLASIAEVKEDFKTARAYLEEALIVYQSPQDLKRIILAQSRLGSIIEQQGDQKLGFQYADQALKSAYQLQDSMLIVSALLNLAIIVWESGQKSLSLAYYEEATILSRKIGALPHLANALMNLGYIYSEQGDFIRAEQNYLESMNTYMTLQYERRGRVSQAYLCFTMMVKEKYSDGFVNLCEAWQFGMRMEDTIVRGLCLTAFIVYKLKNKQQSDARNYYHSLRQHHTHDDVSDLLGMLETFFPRVRANSDVLNEPMSLSELYQHADADLCK